MKTQMMIASLLLVSGFANAQSSTESSSTVNKTAVPAQTQPAAPVVGTETKAEAKAEVKNEKKELKAKIKADKKVLADDKKNGASPEKIAEDKKVLKGDRQAKNELRKEGAQKHSEMNKDKK